MNKKNLILVGVGILIGGLFFKSKNTKNTAVEDIKLPDTSSQNQPPAIAGVLAGSTKIQEPEIAQTLEDPKIKDCKEKWIRFSETQKFRSQEQMESTYNNFMTSCVGRM